MARTKMQARARPAGEEKTISIKIYCDDVPRFKITYKDKDELFRAFQKKVEELGISADHLYWNDWENDRSKIKSADDLFFAVQNCVNVRMFYHSDDDQHRCRSISSHELSSTSAHNYSQLYWSLAPWCYMVDPRFGCVPYHHCSRPSSDKNHLQRTEMCHYCGC